MSAGADRKANALVRAAGGLLERLQRRVALEALGESGCSLGAEAVVSQTASMVEAGGEAVSRGADTKANTSGWRRT